MIIFEIIDEVVTGSGSDSHNTSILETARDLESFAGDIGQSLGGTCAERAAIVFADRGLGIRLGRVSASHPTRGVEIEGETSIQAISANLY